MNVKEGSACAWPAARAQHVAAALGIVVTIVLLLFVTIVITFIYMTFNFYASTLLLFCVSLRMTSGGESVGSDELIAAISKGPTSQEDLPGTPSPEGLLLLQGEGNCQELWRVCDFYPTCKLTRESPAVSRMLEEDTRLLGQRPRTVYHPEQ